MNSAPSSATLFADLADAIQRAHGAGEFLSALWVYLARIAWAEADELKAEGRSVDRETFGTLIRIDLETFERGFLTEDSLAELADAADALGRLGMASTAKAIRLLNAVGSEILSSAQLEDWCREQVREQACPACGEKVRFLDRQVINTLLRPDLRAAAVSGALTEPAECWRCGDSLKWPTFFYIDPGREEFILLWPYVEDCRETIESFLALLDQLPPEFKGRKTQWAFVSGVPAMLFDDPDWGAVTVCNHAEDLVASVNDPIYFDSEATGDLDAMQALMSGHSLVEDGKWEAACAAFARSFLIEPVRVGPLRRLAPCLRNLDRHDEADWLNGEVSRLADKLREGGVLRRAIRFSQPGGGNEELRSQLLANGFPDEWDFGELIARVVAIAARYSDDSAAA
jgi:hypothetical protein